jgi:hypothetical protein
VTAQFDRFALLLVTTLSGHRFGVDIPPSPSKCPSSPHAAKHDDLVPRIDEEHPGRQLQLQAVGTQLPVVPSLEQKERHMLFSLQQMEDAPWYLHRMIPSAAPTGMLTCEQPRSTAAAADPGLSLSC